MNRTKPISVAGALVAVTLWSWSANATRPRGFEDAPPDETKYYITISAHILGIAATTLGALSVVQLNNAENVATQVRKDVGISAIVLGTATVACSIAAMIVISISAPSYLPDALLWSLPVPPMLLGLFGASAGTRNLIHLRKSAVALAPFVLFGGGGLSAPGLGLVGAF